MRRDLRGSARGSQSMGAVPTLRLLGGFELRLASGLTATFARRKAQALLAYLASRPGQAHARPALAALLWPEASETQARSSVRQALYDIHRALRDAGRILALTDDAVCVDPAAIDVDIVALERLVGVGSRPALEEAAGLCRGEFLAGLSVSEPPFEEWLTVERERARELSVQGLTRLLALQTTAGEGVAAVGTALGLLALDPLQGGRRPLRPRRRGHAGERIEVGVLPSDLRAHRARPRSSSAPRVEIARGAVERAVRRGSPRGTGAAPVGGCGRARTGAGRR